MTHYTEIKASPSLAAAVECYWTIRGGVANGQQLEHRVLPDTCIDIVFQLADEPIFVNVPQEGYRCRFVGTMTTALELAYTGHIDLIGVRFRAGRADPFLPAPADVLTDTSVDLPSAWPGMGDLVDQLTPLDTRRRIAVIERLLLKRLYSLPGGWRPDPLVDEGMARLRSTGGRLVMRELQRCLGISERTLERRFSAAIGIPPKIVARVIRLQAATSAILGGCHTLAGIAATTGFADQSHMNREFLALAGTSPAAWARAHGVGFVQDEGAAVA